MRGRDGLALLALVLLVALGRRRRAPSLPVEPTDSGEGSNVGGWQGATSSLWPMPKIVTEGGTFTPEISDKFQRVATQDHRKHHGVDITYPLSFNARMVLVRRGVERLPDRSKRYWVLRGTRALAVEDGQVVDVQRTGRGTHVVLEVAPIRGIPRRAFYQHLDSATVTEGQRLKRGAIVGTVGDDPGHHGDVRHLHFELWDFRGGKWHKRDPGPVMAKWTEYAAQDMKLPESATTRPGFFVVPKGG